MEATSRRLDVKACLEEFCCYGAFNIPSSAIDKVISAIYNEKNKSNSRSKFYKLNFEYRMQKDFLILKPIIKFLFYIIILGEELCKIIAPIMIFQ